MRTSRISSRSTTRPRRRLRLWRSERFSRRRNLLENQSLLLLFLLQSLTPRRLHRNRRRRRRVPLRLRLTVPPGPPRGFRRRWPTCASARSRRRSLRIRDRRRRSSLTVLTVLMETLATSTSSTTGITGNSTKSDGLKSNKSKQKKTYGKQISKAKLLWEFLFLLIYIFFHILYMCDVIGL